MNNTIDKKKPIKVPHTLVIVVVLTLILTALTWVIPAGSFEYETVDVAGTSRSLPITGTFHLLGEDEAKPVGFISFLSSFHRGAVAAADVIGLILLGNGAFFLLIQTKAFDALIGTVMRALQGKERIIIPVFLTIFGIGSSTLAMVNEYNGFYPLLVGLAVALGWDPIVGMAMICLATTMGFAGATLNPFNVGISQAIAGVPMYSNLGFRIFSFVCFFTVASIYIMRYAAKIKKDPTKSIMYGETPLYSFNREELANYRITGRQKIILVITLFCMLSIVYGALELGWGSAQLCGVFLLMGISASIVAGWKFDKIADIFIQGARNVVFAALVTGMARAILIVMQDGQIVDTIINACANMMAGLPALVASEAMLLVHTIVNFFIPSGSGQAATTIPIMAPLGQLIGVSPEVVCITYQYGSSIADALFPTASIAAACGMAGVPINKWWKWFIPLFGILYIVQMILVAVAVVIGL